MTTVGELAASTRNALVGGPFGSNLVSRDYTESGVPVVRGQNMGARWISGDFAFVSPEKAKALEANLARAGDLVFTQRGTLGQVALVPHASHETYVISQSQMKLTVDKSKADPLYLYYVFSAPEQQEYIRQNAIQVGVPHTNLGILRDTPLFLPPLVKQREIAAILGSIDDKIELNRIVSQTLESIAKSIFKCWFIDFDPAQALLDGDTSQSVSERFGIPLGDLRWFGDEFQQSDLEPIPKGWIVSTLGEQAKQHGGLIQTGPFGSQLHAADYVDEGMPVVMPQDLIDRRISTRRIARIAPETASPLKRHALMSGDVVYSRRGDVERHALVSAREAGWLCGTGCLLVRMGDHWPSQAYLSEVLNDPITREWIVRHAVGATMPNLNTGILAAMPMLMPPEPLLEVFEAQIGPMRLHQDALSAESESLAALRDELLPKLLSGELLPDLAVR